jgi:hypothetical protein
MTDQTCSIQKPEMELMINMYFIKTSYQIQGK